MLQVQEKYNKLQAFYENCQQTDKTLSDCVS